MSRGKDVPTPQIVAVPLLTLYIRPDKLWNVLQNLQGLREKLLLLAVLPVSRVFIRQTDKIFGNVWSAYLRSDGSSVCLRNGNDLSVCLHHLPRRHLSVLGRTIRHCRTHERICSRGTVAKCIYTSDYVLVVPAAQKLLRLRELVQSPPPIIPDRVSSNGEGSFVC